MNNKIKVLRLSSMIMTLVMLLASIPFFATAATVEINEELKKIVDVLAPEKLPDDLIESADLDMSKVVGLDEADAQILESFTTINEDGSKTLYAYEVPIKYIDEKTGKIEFIDNTLSELNFTKKLFGSYAYKNAANDFEVSFPKKIDGGILIDDEDFSLSMKPITVNNAPAEYKEYDFVGLTEKVVEYANAFGDGYHLQYNPISSGVKENILIDAYNGTNTFQFKIKAQGLVPEKSEGDMIGFVDEQTGEIVCYINQTYVRDSYVDGKDEFASAEVGGTESETQLDANEVNNDEIADIKIDGAEVDNVRVDVTTSSTVKADDSEVNGIKHISFDNYYTVEALGDYEYLLTSVVDKEFLESETTVYPVLIDPTISRGSILSASVFSGTSARAINDYSTIGNLSGYGQGRTYIKTNALQKYKYINPDKISSAYYHAKEISGNGHAVTVQVWDTLFTTATTSVTYSQCVNSLDGSSPKHTTKENEVKASATYYDIPITSLAKQWLKYELTDGGYTQNYGFVLALANGGSTNYKQFGSHLNSSYPPSIVINYNEDESLSVGTYFIKSKSSGKYLDVANGSSSSPANVQQYQYNSSFAQLWTVTKISAGIYELTPSTNGNLRLDVSDGTDSDQKNIQAFTSNSSQAQRWRIIKNTDGSYRLIPQISSFRGMDVDTGTSNVQLWEYLGTNNQRWIFEIARVYGMVGITDTGHDHTSFMDNPIPSIYKASKNTNIGATVALQGLRSSQVFVGRSHGSKTSFVCNNGNITRSMVIALPANALSSAKLVYYGACLTGEGGADAENLVNATFDRGAKCVIGFTESINFDAGNKWTKKFMASLSDGDTIDTAISKAALAVLLAPGSTNKRLVRGTSNVRIDN